MQEGMYYLNTSVSGGHIFHENVLWENMCSKWTCLAGVCRRNQLSSCECRHLLFFLSTVMFCLLETYFPRIYCLKSSSRYACLFLWFLGFILLLLFFCCCFYFVFFGET